MSDGKRVPGVWSCNWESPPCSCQWRIVVQVDSATVESGKRHSVTELVQHDRAQQ